MRYSPAAAALCLLVAVTSSVGWSSPTEPLDPAAAALVAQARTSLGSGDVNDAVAAYEAALVSQPGNVTVLVGLADANRRNGMQGKALHYYRKALEADPKNLTAIAGEGAALAEKGAVAKAEKNLDRLKRLCGSDCDATRHLATVIARGSAPRVVTAEAVTPEPQVSEN